MLGVLWSLLHVGDIVDIDGLAIMAAYLQAVYIVYCLQEFACHHGQLGASGFHITYQLLRIGLLHRLCHLPQAQTIT